MGLRRKPGEFDPELFQSVADLAEYTLRIEAQLGKLCDAVLPILAAHKSDRQVVTQEQITEAWGKYDASRALPLKWKRSEKSTHSATGGKRDG